MTSTSTSTTADQVVKVALVTGGSSGIGEVTVLQYAQLGYRVAFTGRTDSRIQHVKDQLQGKEYLAIKADFEQPSQVEGVIEQVVQKFGRIDILVNNAGYEGKRKPLEDPDFFDDFRKILQVNLISATRLAQLASPHLIQSKGVIVNVSSVCDRIASPFISYSVAKAGLSMLTKTLANALEGHQVRVVTVAPGPIVTNFTTGMEHTGPMTSLLRPGLSDEVANVIVFATSDKASYIHGSTLDVDGGCYSKFGGIFSAFRKDKPQ